MAYVSKTDWKQPSYEELYPSITDWARLAAYLDGEGSVLINPRRGRSAEYAHIACTFYLKITVANTDIRLGTWLKETFGGSNKDANTPKYYEGKNVKRCWHWSASANRAAWILHNCRQYLIIKGEQADIGMQLQESLNSRARLRFRQVPQEVVEERRELKRRLLVMKARGAKMEPEQRMRIEEVS